MKIGRKRLQTHGKDISKQNGAGGFEITQNGRECVIEKSIKMKETHLGDKSICRQKPKLSNAFKSNAQL